MSQPPNRQPPHTHFPDLRDVPYGYAIGPQPAPVPPRPTGTYDPTAQIRWRLKWLRITRVALLLWCLGTVWVAVSEMHPHHHNPYGATPVVAAVSIFLIIVLCTIKIRKTKRELRAAARAVGPPPGVISSPPGWPPGQR